MSLMVDAAWSEIEVLINTPARLNATGSRMRFRMSATRAFPRRQGMRQGRRQGPAFFGTHRSGIQRGHFGWATFWFLHDLPKQNLALSLDSLRLVNLELSK